MPKKGLATIFPSAKAEILDFLLIHQYWDYNKADIAREAEISYKWVYEVVDEMVKEKLLKKTRCVGKSEMYQINIENPYVKELKKLQLMIMFDKIGDIQEKEQDMLVTTA